MSVSENVLAFALGAGGGYLAWRFLRHGRSGDGSECSVSVTKDGLTANGAKADLASALNLCRQSSKATIAISKDAPPSAVAELLKSLNTAGVPMLLKVA